MRTDAAKYDFRELNEMIRDADDDFEIYNCLGQRFIGSGLGKRKIVIHGVPGNALGAYLNGAEIEVFGNAQDAVGDTMNAGRIVIHGRAGDAAGYAMRGGEIFIRGDAGYRAGIHMKAYREKLPVMVIGGAAGSFLGEYQAGGVIIVLALDCTGKAVGGFPCTGMHGGKMFIRGSVDGIDFPNRVHVRQATSEDLDEIEGALSGFSEYFGVEKDKIMSEKFYVITPDTKNPYKQMYVQN